MSLRERARGFWNGLKTGAMLLPATVDVAIHGDRLTGSGAGAALGKFLMVPLMVGNILWLLLAIGAGVALQATGIPWFVSAPVLYFLPWGVAGAILKFD